MDIYFASPLALSAFYLCKNKPSFFLSGLFLSTAIFIKWQPLILVPIYVSWLLGMLIHYRQIKNPFLWVIGFLTPVVVAVILFRIYDSFPEMLSAFHRAMNHIHPSANAINLNWAMTHYLQFIDPEKFGILQPNGMVDPHKFLWLKKINLSLLCIPYSLCCLLNVLKPTYENFLKTLIIASLSYILLGYGAHENHSFAAVVVACICALISPTLSPSSQASSFKFLALASIHAFINLFIFYVPTGDKLKNSLQFDAPSILALTFCGIYIYLTYVEIKRNNPVLFLKMKLQQLQK